SDLTEPLVPGTKPPAPAAKRLLDIEKGRRRRRIHEKPPSADPVHTPDIANGAAVRTHDDAFGVDLVADLAHALQHRAVGDAGRGENHLARRKLFELVDAVQIGNAPFRRAGLFIVIAEDETALHLPADAAKRRG